MYIQEKDPIKYNFVSKKNTLFSKNPVENPLFPFFLCTKKGFCSMKSGWVSLRTRGVFFIATIYMRKTRQEKKYIAYIYMIQHPWERVPPLPKIRQPRSGCAIYVTRALSIFA